MSTLDQIRKPIATDLEAFDKYVADEFQSENPLVDIMLRDAMSSRGKGIRPTLVMLCAALNSANGIVSRRAWVAAMMVEMIHVSSLIHDDVIDDADTRRGKPSLNALWQSKRAVLTGDYILAKNLSIGLSSGQYDIVNHVVKAIAILCEGEVIQDDCARRQAMTREEYLKIIAKKTASLISISASAGAMAAGGSPKSIERMKYFGEAIGMAFQIQDDILDYTPTANTGKPSNNDLREGKITLPMLAILERGDKSLNAQIMELLAKSGQDEEAVDELQKIVLREGGVDFAREVMSAYVAKATAILAEYPDSEYRTALMNLCAFITDRDN
ncbi:MAG: polyprenyl synthetase family protein [Rikenellaceae bacterium]